MFLSDSPISGGTAKGACPSSGYCSAKRPAHQTTAHLRYADMCPRSRSLTAPATNAGAHRKRAIAAPAPFLPTKEKLLLLREETVENSLAFALRRRNERISGGRSGYPSLQRMIRGDKPCVTGTYPRGLLHPCQTRLAGLEPATAGLEGRCSIQLSYRRSNTPYKGYDRTRS